ncbi:YeeE/YedE thiosulfate transporter family protein [Geotalea toluenoxydans]|uniref:YeeE/YedE thiosulfate transporter family protein n=1 Tax=Geotalea toluenoxydans TaxID=421624 RepID=UPI0006D15743|nr:YeeE/YedE thiosulfate transporter family protein [Geotalea toluenoxydans]
MFDEPSKLLLGLVTGILFGVLLQKGQVAKFQVILGQLLLKDWTVFKIMGTAIAVGTIGVNILVAAGIASLHIQTASVARVVIGGTLFGIGMAVFGLCPGTSVAASGEGRRDAMVGVIGMLCGAGAYVALFPKLQPLFKSMPDFGKVTLPQFTQSSTGGWALGVAVVLGAVVFLLHKRTDMKSRGTA